jgi:hypothetical protein
MIRNFVGSLLLVLLPLSAVSQAPQREASVRKAIDLQTAELWEKEDFSQLEKISSDYRMNKTQTPSGLWKLTVFYGSLREQVSSDVDKPAWWEFMRTRAAKWTSRFPTSPTAHLQYAESMLRRAWHVRGAGFSGEVTPQGLKLFQEKIAEARKYLDNHKGVAAVDPRWYELMINIATWQGWKEPEVKTLIEEAVSREPTWRGSKIRTRWIGGLKDKSDCVSL